MVRGGCSGVSAVASAVGVVQLYLDLNDWWLLARLWLTNCIKIAISGSAQSSCQTLCCCYQRKGGGRERDRERAREGYSIVGGGTRCIFVGFLEIHSCCRCSCCCRSGWACSIEPKLTAILPVPPVPPPVPLLPWLASLAWSRGQTAQKARRFQRFVVFFVPLSVRLGLGVSRAVPGWLTRAQVQEFFSCSLSLSLDLKLKLELDLDSDCDRGRK